MTTDKLRWEKKEDINISMYSSSIYLLNFSAKDRAERIEGFCISD